jgi:hypothetical protein
MGSIELPSKILMSSQRICHEFFTPIPKGMWQCIVLVERPGSSDNTGLSRKPRGRAGPANS